MGNLKKEKTLIESSEGIAKMLLWLGLAFIAGFSYMAGKKGWSEKIMRIPAAIAREFGYNIPGNEPIFHPVSFNSIVVLVGSYDSPGEAKGMKDRLAQSRIVSKVQYQHGRFHVIVGPFVTENQAKYVYKNVQAKGFPAELIIPIKAKSPRS